MKGINVRLENQDFTKSSKSFLQDLKNSVELPRLNGVFETMAGFAWLRRILDNRMLMIVLLLLLPFCWWFAPIAYIGLMCLDAKFDLLLDKGAKTLITRLLQTAISNEAQPIPVRAVKAISRLFP